MPVTDTSTASFVTEILTTAGKFEKQDINAKLGKLSRRIEEIKVEVYDALRKKYDEFNPNFNTAVDLNRKVETLSCEMDNMANKIENEIKSQLQVSTAEFSDLSGQLKESRSILAILEKLSEIHNHLQSIEENLKTHNYVAATRCLREIHVLLSKPVHEGESEMKILQKLQTHYKSQEEELKDDLHAAWSEHLKWHLPGASDKSKSVKVELSIFSGNQAVEIMKNASQAMVELGVLHDTLSLCASRILTYYVQPMVRVTDLNYMEVSSATYNDFVVTYRPSQDISQSITPSVVFQRLVALLHFIDRNLSFEISIEDNGASGNLSLLRYLGNIISGELIELLIDECLKQSIPSSHRDIDKYDDIISQAETFQQELVRLQFITEDNSTLYDYVSNVNVLFANKKCQEVLEAARFLMTAHIHNAVEVSDDHALGDLVPLPGVGGGSKKGKTAVEFSGLPTDAQLSAKVLKLPKCCISTSVQELMLLVYETLQEASNSSRECACQLFYCVRRIFELFCSVVPKFHKENLQTLPQQAALHHNNCMYLGHHLLTLGHQYKHKLPEPLKEGAATFVDLVPVLRRLGTQCFLDQMSRQEEELFQLLKATTGLVNLSEGENSRVSERAVKQVLYKLQQLANVWEPVLPSNIYYKSIGTLLNSVLVEILNNIVSLDDISADDASQLHLLLSQITSKAPDFYKNTANTDNPPEFLLQKYIRKWLKFKEMLVLLNAGLLEISDRWADGKGPLAYEYSANEVKQVVRALFQNTDRRAAVLGRIK